MLCTKMNGITLKAVTEINFNDMAKTSDLGTAIVIENYGICFCEISDINLQNFIDETTGSSEISGVMRQWSQLLNL